VQARREYRAQGIPGPRGLRQADLVEHLPPVRKNDRCLYTNGNKVVQRPSHGIDRAGLGGGEAQGKSREDFGQSMQARCRIGSLPTAIVAFEGDSVLGTAALKPDDLEIRSHLTPWLGGVCVAAAPRSWRRLHVGHPVGDRGTGPRIERTIFVDAFLGEPLCSARLEGFRESIISRA
jgi:hypothetical protein